jgi:hypothetical protein
MPNTTGRGHPPRVGGAKSTGTKQKAVRISREMWVVLKAKYGNKFAFSEYVRRLIDQDLGK